MTLRAAMGDGTASFTLIVIAAAAVLLWLQVARCRRRQSAAFVAHEGQWRKRTFDDDEKQRLVAFAGPA